MPLFLLTIPPLGEGNEILVSGSRFPSLLVASSSVRKIARQRERRAPDRSWPQGWPGIDECPAHQESCQGMWEGSRNPF